MAIECPKIDESLLIFPDAVDVGDINTPIKDIEQGRQYGIAYLRAREAFNNLKTAQETRERVCSELGMSLQETSKLIDEEIEKIQQEAQEKERKFLGVF